MYDYKIINQISNFNSPGLGPNKLANNNERQSNIFERYNDKGIYEFRLHIKWITNTSIKMMTITC